MAKLLKILGLSLVIWSLSLLWPISPIVLTPSTMAWLIIGLSLTLIAYLAGQYVGQNRRQTGAKRPQKNFNNQPTRPVVVAQVRSHFSRRTAPMPVIAHRSPASRPTRPIPLAR